MKNNDNLEYYYSGDEVWNRILLLSEKAWNNSKLQSLLVENLNYHTDIAKVMCAKLGEESLDWVHQKVPALDYLTPLECLESPELIKRLKECLMRMP